jgi:putative transposase
MPRQGRVIVAGAPLHVVQRGNNRSNCFLCSHDYELYLGLLDELAPLFACSVHAFVLMTNHVHLLLTPGDEEAASKLMKHLSQRYAQYMNRMHRRTGSLWEGRFRSSVVDSENYLLRCYRYVELNPVRAGIVAHPSEYPWSSYGVNAMGTPSSIVVAHERYMALGDHPSRRQAAYRELFREQLGLQELGRIRHAVNGNFALGSEGFRAGIETSAARCVPDLSRV